MEENKITMLGTGNALVTKCYNTCFVLESGGRRLLVDAGGGNGVLVQLEKAGISVGDIHDLFITHAHSDHLLGCIWIVRIFIQRSMAGLFQGVLNIWSHEKVLRVLEYNLREMLTRKQAEQLGRLVVLHEVKDRDEIECAGLHLQCFDILSTKEKQFGFTTRLPDGQRLVCLGDEPYNEANRAYVEGADWMMCEAFCKYADRDTFHPYEKNHSTALDAARLAEQLGVKNLILYHREDKTLATQKEDYAAEARSAFGGQVFVPCDLDVIPLCTPLEARVQRAVDYFMHGFGCCQSVVAAFADLYGLDEETAKRIGAGFGGGVGRMRMMCGAVSGIVTLVGLECGQTEGDDREGKSACYKVVQELLAQSKEQNGSLICAEILGLNGHEKAQSSYVASPRTAEYYKTRPCAAKVESAARIFAQYLAKKK